MGLMDDLKNVQPLELGGTGKTFIDADTLVDNESGEKYRIQGVDAAEVEKILPSGYKQGTAGGEATTGILQRLANEQGFTNIVPVMDEKGRPVRDDFGRILTDLTDDSGKSFKTSLLEAGAFDINKYTTQEDIAATEIARGRRDTDIVDGDYTTTAFDQAALDIRQAEQEEGAKQFGFKRTALNEAERQRYIDAGYGHLLADNVQVRNFDRTLDNKSLNPWSDSWDQGWIGVGESAFGIANLLGTVTDQEGLAQWGEDGVARQRAKLADFGSTILDYKDVKGFGDAIEYLGNNLALSIPYMGATVIGTVAAPATGGASLALPVSLYTGQTWNEMEGEKSASIAIGAGVVQAALDRLGLAGIVKAGGAPKEVLNRGINALVGQGVSREAAEQQVMAATRREIANLAGTASQIAKEQIRAKAIGKDLLKRFGVSGTGEALTEAGQEGTAYLAAVYGSDKEFDWHDLNNRLISAAVAGGTLGGALSVPGKIYDTGAWADVAYRLDPATTETESDAGIYAAEEKSRFGRVASVEELANDARLRWEAAPGASLEERADQHRAAQTGRSFTDKLTEQALNVSQLWQGATRNIFTPELKQRSRSARILADMFGGSLQRTFSGSSFENSKFHRVATYKNMVMTPANFYETIIGRGGITASRKGDISKTTYSALQAAVNQDGTFNPDLVPTNTPNRALVVQLGQELNILSDRMYQDQRKHNPELGYIKNYLHKYKAVNKGAVNRNRAKFIDALIQNGYTRDDAAKLTDEIIHNNEVGDIDSAFSVVKGGVVPGAHRRRSLNMSEKEEFQEFMEQDLFANVAQAVKSAARYTAHRDYIGKNAGVISKLLEDMQQEGVSEAEVNKVAARMQDYLDAESGNYKRPQSELGKNAQALQKNFMMLTTLAGLPLATISSFVETMLIHRGMRQDQIFGKEGSIQATGKELADTLWHGAKQVGTLGLAKEGEYNPRQEILKDLGFYEWDVGAATVTGVSEVNPWQQWVYEGFFKWTGLSGFTNFTRAARASLAQDYMTDKIEMIAKYRRSGEPRTRELQEAEEGLRNLGIDIDRYHDIYNKKMAQLPLTPAEETFIADTTREATFTFVNEAIALPGSANRPLIYQDPRFALFTQFQGFIATFTANHIPKLWNEYVKRGTPAMKYNAFALATTMIMMGFVSQYLKDLIKYGQTSPHLDNAELIQRGVRASGLLGTGERVLDQFFPLYEQRTEGTADWVFKTGTGESPALSHAGRIGKALGAGITGDAERAAYYGLRSAPIAGPFTDLDKFLAQGITGGGWNFKGDN